MRLLPYSFSLLNSIFFNKDITNFILNLKDKIQEFMLCLKGQIHRKILVTMKFQEDVFTTAVVIGTDCACSCKSNYHTTTTVRGRYRIVIILCKLQSFSIHFLIGRPWGRALMGSNHRV